MSEPSDFRSIPSTLAERDDGAPDSPSRRVRSGFRGDIEGLRAVAVLAVVLFHAGLPGIGGGFIGVDVFFVISGFLITGLLWREVGAAGTVRLRRFYGARARRLLPASATVGVVTAIGSAILLPPLQARPVLGDGIACALYVGNFRFLQEGTDYFFSETSPSPFQHYWSLGVEEQFYLVWPAMIIGAALLIRFARRWTRALATSSTSPYLLVLLLVGAGSFALSLAVIRVAPTAAFFSTFTRAWELAVGGLVALTAGQWRRLRPLPAAIAGWGGLAIVLLACTRFSTITPFPGTAAVLPVLGTALAIGAGCAAPARGVGRVLSLPPMQAIGRVSYSWYLWHWPLLVLAPPLLGHPLGLAGRLTATLISGGLAVLTLRYVENPFRFGAFVRRSDARSLAIGGAATAVAVCVSVALQMLVPLPIGRGPAAPALAVTAAPPPAGGSADLYDAAVQQAFAQVQAGVAAAAGLQAVPSNLVPPIVEAAAEKQAMYLNGCMRNFFEVGQPECATGDTASATTLALVGDSNAAMWNSAFQQLVTQRHWRLESLTKVGCPLLDLSLTTPLLRREYTECEQWRGQILTRLGAEHPRLVVLSISRTYRDQGFTSYDPAYIDSLTRLVQQLRTTGAKVLVLGPIPLPNGVVPICLSGHLDDVSACSASRSKAVNEPGITAEAGATEAVGGRYANLTSLFCTAELCPVIVGNTLLYVDQVHLTLEYSRLLAPAIGALADRALVSG